MNRDASGEIWKGAEIGTSVPEKLGCITLPMWMCSSALKLSKAYTTGILWRLPPVGMIKY